MTTKFFDAVKDREIVATGGFWCFACLVSRPIEEKSPDPRYCQGCFEFLVEEATLVPSLKRPVWLPRQENGGENTIPVVRRGRARKNAQISFTALRRACKGVKKHKTTRNKGVK